MSENLTFEEIYEAYMLCLKNKKRKQGTYTFVNENLCENLIELVDELNTHTYKPKPSNCYVITEPALREIYAAQFSDRVVQHFYMKEIEDILEEELVEGCCSCRKYKGADYALKLLKTYLLETSETGKKDCYFLKIDLSGYFMSIDRKQVSQKFYNLIANKYKGKHKDLLLYLTPIIFENNPALNCRYKCNEIMREKVPKRRKMDVNSEYGMAIGNLTAQAGSNLNLSDFDSYIVHELNLKQYVRYVDDIVIIADKKEKLLNSLELIETKLNETHQKVNRKKTIIDTAYHGVPFLGKMSYPYGYQKPGKQVIKRVYQKAKNTTYSDDEDLLAKTNSQIGFLKNYNARKLIINYANLLPPEIHDKLLFNESEYKFEKKEDNT